MSKPVGVLADVRYLVDGYRKYQKDRERDQRYRDILHLFAPDPNVSGGIRLRLYSSGCRYQALAMHLKALRCEVAAHSLTGLRMGKPTHEVIERRRKADGQIRWMRIYSLGMLIGLDLRDAAEFRLSRVIYDGLQSEAYGAI